MQLPEPIETYFAAGNKHQITVMPGCFADQAIVHDEKNVHQGKTEIGLWLKETIEKYCFQCRPLNIKTKNDDLIITTEISGAFDGSPVTLDYLFTLNMEKISSLVIE